MQRVTDFPRLEKATLRQSRASSLGTPQKSCDNGEKVIEDTPENPALTIAGGHAINGLCSVLGEFDALAARVTTRIKAWKSTETGQDVAVDAPDTVSVAGVLQSGAEVSVHVSQHTNYDS